MLEETSLQALLLGGSWLVGYLLGAFPSGQLFARHALRGQSLKCLGSGGTGATNVLRAAGRRAAALTLLADSVKGVLAILIADWGASQLALSQDLLPSLPQDRFAALAAFGAVLGHCFPPWGWQFMGGKGTATGFGVLATLAPQTALFALGAWIAAVALTRISSLGSLIGCPIIMFLLLRGDQPLATTIALILSAALILARHRPNLRRLLKGQEPKIGQKV